MFIPLIMLFLIFALVILVFLSLVQKYYSLAVFYPMLGGLLFGSWLLTMNSYHPHEISWGINEYVQDQISNDWGLEKFYQMALKSIEKEPLHQNLWAKSGSGSSPSW